MFSYMYVYTYFFVLIYSSKNNNEYNKQNRYNSNNPSTCPSEALAGASGGEAATTGPPTSDSALQCAWRHFRGLGVEDL